MQNICFVSPSYIKNCLALLEKPRKMLRNRSDDFKYNMTRWDPEVRIFIFFGEADLFLQILKSLMMIRSLIQTNSLVSWLIDYVPASIL